jgi:hypothetical protein
MPASLDVHPRVAMQILRHTKISITMEIYTEIPDASTRDALRRLGGGGHVRPVRAGSRVTPPAG